jgi:ribosomal protein S17
MTVIGEKNIKELVGEVVSDKMMNTRVVVVRSVKVHPIYKKRF